MMGSVKSGRSPNVEEAVIPKRKPLNLFIYVVYISAQIGDNLRF